MKPFLCLLLVVLSNNFFDVDAYYSYYPGNFGGRRGLQHFNRRWIKKPKKAYTKKQYYPFPYYQPKVMVKQAVKTTTTSTTSTTTTTTSTTTTTAIPDVTSIMVDVASSDGKCGFSNELANGEEPYTMDETKRLEKRKKVPVMFRRLATASEFPWVVTLSFSARPWALCYGALISSVTILTTKSCFMANIRNWRRPRNFVATWGNYDDAWAKVEEGSNNNPNEQQQPHLISRTIVPVLNRTFFIDPTDTVVAIRLEQG